MVVTGRALGRGRGQAGGDTRKTWPVFVPFSTLLYEKRGTRVSLRDSLMFWRLAMGFANVRAGTRVLMLVLVQAERRRRQGC